ncbi:MAG: TolC family outer membrane protein [Pseudomonadales bacterium]
MTRYKVFDTVFYRAFFVLLWFALSGPASAVTLEEAIQATLRTNPDILANEHNVAAAEEVHRQARGAYLPRIDLMLAGGYENSNNSTTRAAGVDELDLTREEASLKVTQLLYDGFATSNFVSQQGALLDAAIARLVSSKENVSLRAAQVYLEVLRRQKVVGLAQENLAHHNNTLEKIQERFESGVGTRVDLVQTEGRRSQSRSNLLLAERDVKNSSARYRRVVGEVPAGLVEPGPVSDLPATLEAAIEIAYRNSPQVLAAEAELEAAVAARKQARGSFHPRFDLELGATRNEDTDGTVGPNDDETAIVRMTYNLYRGGSDRARLNASEAREFAARERLRSVKRAVEEDVTLIWNELQDILARLEYLEAHVNSTEEVLRVYNEQLSLGKRTLLDVLDIQNELLRAKVAYVAGQYTVKLARYRVLASSGQLLSTLGLGQGMMAR